MFCKVCGKEMNDAALFCNECGTPVGQTVGTSVKSSEDRKKEDNIVRLEIKPTFVWGYQILKMIGKTLLWLLLLELFFINLIWALINFPILGWSIVGIVFLIFFIKMFFEKAQYTKLRYKFLKTKVEYVDGFLNKEEKQLKYEHIREVTMSQNIIERMFGIGRIRLFTNASSAYNTSRNHKQTGKNGIDIHCVTNIKEQYKIVKDLLDGLEEQDI